MKMNLLGLVVLAALMIQTVSLHAQMPAVEQVWPTASDAPSFSESQGTFWVAANPYNHHVYVYVYGKLLKSIDNGLTWNEIGKGLPKNAYFLGINDFYACPLTFSPFALDGEHVIGDTMLLGNSNKGGVPYRSDDDGETWHPINICENGPQNGTVELNFNFAAASVGVFSNLNKNNIFISGISQGAGAVFVGEMDPLSKRLQIFHNFLFPSTHHDGCYTTKWDIVPRQKLMDRLT